VIVAASKVVSRVVPQGDRRASLIALRDRLAEETNDVTWAKHKRECSCACGIGDGRVLVALVKELRAVIAELDSLPGKEGVTRLDQIAAGVTELSTRRRRGAAAGS
jgi:hypothetical protein